jgi:hypothetical protein
MLQDGLEWISWKPKQQKRARDFDMLAVADHTINIRYHILLNYTSILANKSRCMDRITHTHTQKKKKPLIHNFLLHPTFLSFFTQPSSPVL